MSSPSAPPSSTARRIGMVLCLAMLALLTFAFLARQSSPGDFMYMLVRWPLIVLACIAPVFLVVRTVLRRRAAATGASHAAQDLE